MPAAATVPTSLADTKPERRRTIPLIDQPTRDFRMAARVILQGTNLSEVIDYIFQ
jgi:hypothetical protein